MLTLLISRQIVDAVHFGGRGDGRSRTLERSCAVYQPVTYRVGRVLMDRNGRVAQGMPLTVDHAIVDGAATADSTPRLRPELTRPAADVFVFAKRREGRWIGVDGDVGVVLARPANRATLAVREAVERLDR